MKKISIFGVLTAFSSLANAQEESGVSKFNNMYFWAEVGKAKDYNIAIYGGVSVQVDHNYFKIKAGGVMDNPSEEQRELIKDYYGDEKRDVPSPGVDTYSLIYGRSYPLLKVCQIQFGTGISYVEKKDKDLVFNSEKRPVEPEKYIKKGTIGLPVEIKYSIHYKRYLSASCSYNINVNPIKSISGFSFGLALGLF